MTPVAASAGHGPVKDSRNTTYALDQSVDCLDAMMLVVQTQSAHLQQHLGFRHSAVHVMPLSMTDGGYARALARSEIDQVRCEIADWRLAAAASFWEFEDSLPPE